MYIYCRKFNVEFNKLIKTAGHCAGLKKEKDVEHTQFDNKFDFILIVSYSHLSSP